MEVVLGKITSAYFGLGGYQDVQLGIHLCFEGGGGGVCDTKSYWDMESIECTSRSVWDENDRTNGYSEVMRFISKLLKDAKVDSVDKLVGIPVEITYDGLALKEWRVLTEVL